MPEQQGYWDVHRCAWVGAATMHVFPPATSSEDGAQAAAAVPEQRPADAAAPDATVAPA